MSGAHVKAPENTPMKGLVHEVPPEAVWKLESVWTRYKMAGIELGRTSETANRLSLATAVVTAITGLGVFTTLQSEAETNVLVRVVVFVFLATSAALAAWQTVESKRADANRKDLLGLLLTFGPLKEELIHAVSDCRMRGTPVDADLLSRAQQALDAHASSNPGEYPSFDPAEHKVHEELASLGLRVEPRGPSRR